MNSQSITPVATRNLFLGVNRLADPRNPTDLEKKHIPVIDAPGSIGQGECFAVTVEVGKLLAHPNERGHFIEFIDLYADELFLTRVDLTAVHTCPKAILCVALSSPAKELRAYGRCNIHGVWVGTAPITVKE
jgi:superoxide reductase